MIKKYLPEDYKQNRKYELSQKVFKLGEDVDQFFYDMQNLFQEIDSNMSKEYKVAEIRRSINNVPDYRRFLAVAETDTVQKIRTVRTRLATIDKTEPVIPQKISVQPTEIKHYIEILGEHQPRISSVGFATANGLPISFIIISSGTLRKKKYPKGFIKIEIMIEVAGVTVEIVFAGEKQLEIAQLSIARAVIGGILQIMREIEMVAGVEVTMILEVIMGIIQIGIEIGHVDVL